MQRPANSWHPRNAPNFWLREMVQMRRYPGLLQADYFEHFCPNHVLYLNSTWRELSEKSAQLLCSDSDFFTCFPTL